MKAIVLAAGMGSRIKPLTDNTPKSLLKIGGVTILERMLSNIQACGINDVIFVLGYMQDQIKEFVKNGFPDLNAEFVVNDRYAETNTGFSLMLTEGLVQGSPFVKFDADVVFEIGILEKLLACDGHNFLCIDKNIQLDAEEIKVVVRKDSRILKANKSVAPKDAIGESIGIELIRSHTVDPLFSELKIMMRQKKNHQEYYEGAYERLMENDVPFYALDISGMKWTEIDTKADFDAAKKIFI
ncbi:MAG: phosphocholine cytidylyltransferase family protein [Magnetococcales bacterium]|nr:phosphocholine cytidylyltransferase family protein [Magnetococcales bacterium]